MKFADLYDRLETIRKFINTPRIQHPILSKGEVWNKLCSSLDIVDDTGLAISAYVQSPYPQDEGGKYLFLFGLFQALYVQTDALKHIAEALSISLELPESVRKLRELRNDAVGHPTSRHKKRTSSFIVRTGLSKDAFDLTTISPDGKDDANRTVNVTQAIEEEAMLACGLLDQVIETMKEREAKHKGRFSETKCANIFPRNMEYLFSKVSEGIVSSDPSQRRLGKTHLEMIKNSYARFKKELEQRDEIPANDALVYELDEIMYPISKLEAFFSDQAVSGMNDRDAAIYAAFVREKHGEMLKIAQELDEEYGNEEGD